MHPTTGGSLLQTETSRITWWCALLSLLAILLLPLTLVELPPLLDYPNHLARMFVLENDADPVLVLELRMAAGTIVRLSGTSLMSPSPSRPGENEGDPGDRLEQQPCEQDADLRNAEHAGCDQAQAARDTGLLSFALFPVARRS